MKRKNLSKLFLIVALTFPFIISCKKGTHTCTCTTSGAITTLEYTNITAAEAEDNCAEYNANHPESDCSLE